MELNIFIFISFECGHSKDNNSNNNKRSMVGKLDFLCECNLSIMCMSDVHLHILIAVWNHHNNKKNRFFVSYLKHDIFDVADRNFFETKPLSH